MSKDVKSSKNEHKIENENIAHALTFHRGSNHPDGDLMNTLTLYRPGIQPHLHNRFVQDFPTVELPQPNDIDVPAKKTLKEKNQPRQSIEYFPSMDDLSTFLHYSAGITKTLTKGGREMDFRAASCTGKLYHIEIYLVTGKTSNLEAGVYYYNPQKHNLYQLRLGDYRQSIVESTAGYDDLEKTPFFLIYTSSFWRNAYKYKARAYRHAFWDSGTILANSFTIATAMGLPSEVITGFIDKKVSKIIGIDNTREIPLEIVPLGYDTGIKLPSSPSIETAIFEQEESKLQQEWAAITKIHNASSITEIEQLKKWRENNLKLESYSPSNKKVTLPDLNNMSEETLASVIRRRGSTREFSQESISSQTLSNILKLAITPISTDYHDVNEFNYFNEMYVIIHSVDDLESGSYRYLPQEEELEILQKGEFRKEAKELGLGQDLAKNAAANIFFITDLQPVLDTFGNRGYRLAQLEAAILGGKTYLAAYLNKIGATALTFRDPKVTEFFSPQTENKQVMFMMNFGNPAY